MMSRIKCLILATVEHLGMFQLPLSASRPWIGEAFYMVSTPIREMTKNSPIPPPDMPSGVGFRILANRNIWRFPNIAGEIYTHFADRGVVRQTSGIFRVIGNAIDPPANGTTIVSNEAWLGASLDASRGSSIYQSSLTEVRVNALYGLSLIRAYQA